VIRRAVTDEIMYAIASLSEQEYVDTYHQRPAA
jgi:1-acyl-sn-glycerol-3-phosphate acyltransferase